MNSLADLDKTYEQLRQKYEESEKNYKNAKEDAKEHMKKKAKKQEKTKKKGTLDSFFDESHEFGELDRIAENIFNFGV